MGEWNVCLSLSLSDSRPPISVTVSFSDSVSCPNEGKVNIPASGATVCGEPACTLCTCALLVALVPVQPAHLRLWAHERELESYMENIETRLVGMNSLCSICILWFWLTAFCHAHPTSPPCPSPSSSLCFSDRTFPCQVRLMPHILL